MLCSEGAFFSWWWCLCVGLGEVEGDVGRRFWFEFELGLGCRLSWSMLLDRPFPSNPTLFSPMAEKNRRRESLGRPSRCSTSVPALKKTGQVITGYLYMFIHVTLYISWFLIMVLWHLYKCLCNCDSRSVGGSVVVDKKSVISKSGPHLSWPTLSLNCQSNLYDCCPGN